MPESQMSQLETGQFFRKISLFDSASFYFAPLAGSDDEANVLYSARDMGARDENLHRSQTWYFRAKIDWNLPNLDGCAAFQRIPPERMLGRA